MKKFLIMLNDFLHVKEYERRIVEREKRIKSELRYCQDLLLAETIDDPQDAWMMNKKTLAEVAIYVEFLKEERRREKQFRTILQKL